MFTPARGLISKHIGSDSTTAAARTGPACDFYARKHPIVLIADYASKASSAHAIKTLAIKNAMEIVRSMSRAAVAVCEKVVELKLLVVGTFPQSGGGTMSTPHQASAISQFPSIATNLRSW